MKTRWFWGGFLILSAVILVTNALGIFEYRIGFFTLIMTIALIAALLGSLRELNMPGVVFSVAFMAIIYARPLHITALVPWTILGAAVLLSMGLGLLIHPRHRNWERRYRHHHFHEHWRGDSFEETNTATVDDANVNLDLSMANSIRYIHSNDLQTANIHVNMAGAKLYFDDVQLHNQKATFNIDVSLSGVELYVPKTWQLDFQLNNNLGHITETGHAESAGPVVTLIGSVSLGELTIIYI